MHRTVLGCQDFSKLSYILARQIPADSVDYVVGIWRGGTTPGIIVHEFLEKMHGTRLGHFPIQTNGYEEMREKRLEVSGLEAFARVKRGQRVLLVDDVWDTGRALSYVCGYLREKEIIPYTAVVVYKPLKSKVGGHPDFYVLENNDWIVFPHELEGVSRENVRQKEQEWLSALSLEDVLYAPLADVQRKVERIKELGQWWFSPRSRASLGRPPLR
jgi:uncharacterized protein